MELTIHNVGFGDFFLLSDEQEHCFVDCGGRRKAEVSALALQAIERLGAKKSLKGVVTHFHNDHYNGYRDLSNHKSGLFDQLLLPYIVVDEQANRPVIIEMAAYFYTFLSPNTQTWQVSANILNALGDLSRIAKNNNIRFVSTGDEFSIGSKQFEVLWPDREMLFDENLKRYLYELDEKTGDMLRWRDVREQLRYSYIRWLDSQSNVETLGSLVEEQEVIISQLDDIRESQVQEGNQRIISNSLRYHGTKLFSSSNNSTSIVFHEKREHCEDDNFVLMTGDVEKRIIDEKLRDRFDNSYHILKAPHHGTDNHYSNNLPQAKNIMISTGARTNYGKISENYRLHCEQDAPRYCTGGNNWCENVNAGQVCENANCSVARWMISAS